MIDARAEDRTLIVGILDDDVDLAESVARLLGRHGYSTRSFAAANQLLDGLAHDPFGCVISDVQMPDMDGFAFAEALRAADPAVAIIFMTAWPMTGHAVDAVRRHGGLDYLEKPINEARLTASVTEGIAWSTQKRSISAATSELSRRERDVFELLVRGHSNKEIAEILAISARTVEDHRAAIVSKTRTNGLAQLIALSRGLVT